MKTMNNIPEPTSHARRRELLLDTLLQHFYDAQTTDEEETQLLRLLSAPDLPPAYAKERDIVQSLLLPPTLLSRLNAVTEKPDSRRETRCLLHERRLDQYIDADKSLRNIGGDVSHVANISSPAHIHLKAGFLRRYAVAAAFIGIIGGASGALSALVGETKGNAITLAAFYQDTFSSPEDAEEYAMGKLLAVSQKVNKGLDTAKDAIRQIKLPKM